MAASSSKAKLFTIEQCIAENIPLSAGYRDFEGYKGKYPDPKWPNGAKICVNLVLNYEEGAEHSVLNGDTHSENFLNEMPGWPSRLGGRDIQAESQYEYGTRVGVWRLSNFFKEEGIHVTVYAVGQSILKSPDAAKKLAEDGHEFASHGYRWIDHHMLPLAVEKEQINKAIDAIEKISGKPPRGWYYGRPSMSSLGLISQVFKERGIEFLYSADSYADELPYWVPHPLEEGEGLLIVPYTFDVNDVKYTMSPGFVNPKDWLDYAKLAFDVMYEEGKAGSPKMMTIGLHSRVVGKPARFWALRELVKHIKSHDGVWFATREEIARHWIKEHPFKKEDMVETISNRIAHFI
ncbi:carbohydrate esterase family 4 protein [Xylogone sp. PMI_703]|nr:carbohydrate esterase family 4 protein [Xylogone sp. PMI_703]